MEDNELMLKMWDRLNNIGDEVSETRAKVESIESSLMSVNSYVGAQAAKLVDLDKRVESKFAEQRGVWRVVVGVASAIGIVIGWIVAVASKWI